jgi:aspartate racemase
VKTIGVIGGLSWQSTLEYYRLINNLVEKRTDDCAKMVVINAPNREINTLIQKDDRKRIGEITRGLAEKLRATGCDFFLITANGMHRFLNEMQPLPLPILDIRTVTAKAIEAKGFTRVGLLGVKATMAESFYRDELNQHGVQAIVPEPADQDLVHNLIYDELVKGKFTDKGRNAVNQVMDRLSERGAEGMILGCTELPLLLRNENDSKHLLFSTTNLHAEAAVNLALS